MTRPSLFTQSESLWSKREARFVAIVERALLLLRAMSSLPRNETELNRKLYFCLLQASRELFPNEELAPVCECNNQPDPDDSSRASRELKRPDFQWAFLDRYESDPNRSSRQFVVECKRLGAPERADWIFNLNYTDHGIVRFRSKIWGYGRGAASGLMIGYWQSMDFNDLVIDVNGPCTAQGFPALTTTHAPSPDGLARLDHAWDRTFDQTPFRLGHVWADLRNSAQASGA
jgi:hypothetical protein